MTHTFYDRVVFDKFKAVMGGKVRFMITGSAPISKDVLNFLKIAFCCPISEGYGQTESAAPASMTLSADPECGHIGGPYPTCDFKLVDLPDMNYTSKDKTEDGEAMPRGEICFRGYNTFKGYFGQPEQTKETIDEDGWVHTGDIGQIRPNGSIKIIDRQKNIFKLSQGEYIIPDKLENKFTTSSYIQQIFVYGDSLQNNVVAVVIPEKHHLEKWAKENGVSDSNYEELLKDDKAKKFYLEEIKKMAKEAGVSHIRLY